MNRIDLNCDMGEGLGVYSLGDDEAMLDVVTSANLACGFHAGDPLVMYRALSSARAKGVAAGAHPSFLDLWGFGRRPILGERPADVEKHVIYQIGAAQALADDELADAVANAIGIVSRDLIFVVMPGLATERAALRAGLPLAREVYADRAYGPGGNLVSRKQAGSVIHDVDAAVARVLRMVEAQSIETQDGGAIRTRIDSVAVHGDTPGAVAMARRIRDALVQAGMELRPMAEVIASS